MMGKIFWQLAFEPTLSRNSRKCGRESRTLSCKSTLPISGLSPAIPTLLHASGLGFEQRETFYLPLFGMKNSRDHETFTSKTLIQHFSGRIPVHFTRIASDQRLAWPPRSWAPVKFQQSLASGMFA
jgi:hypothetical protein